MGARAIAEARRWIGTPHVHGASLCGVGADCLGLVRGVWRALVGAEPEAPSPYPADWATAGCDERLWRAARRWFQERGPGDWRSGDVALLRMRRDGPAQHMGVLAEDDAGRPTLVHAHGRLGVVESPLGEAWRVRLVAALAFPAGEDAWRR